MIYIDPPYNTGNDSFIYPDNYKTSRKAYDKEAGIRDENGNLKIRFQKNTKESGHYHSAWLSMLYPRLFLARNLLRDDGVIFISINDNEQANLKLLCDEIFGEENFLCQITLLCNPKGRSQDKYVANCHEYIFGYSKNSLKKGMLNILKGQDEVEKNYRLHDTYGHYRELELRNTHREFGKHNRKNLYYPFFVTSEGLISVEKLQDAESIYPDWEDGFEGCWTWGIEKAKEEINKLVAKKVSGKWKIYRKNYAKNEDGEVTKQVKSIWVEKSFHTEKGQASLNNLFGNRAKVFQFPKSIETLIQLLQMGADKDSLVLDFFAGSGTLAHAVMALNAEDGGKRRSISVQLPEQIEEKHEAYKAGYRFISEITRERIEKVIKKFSQEKGESENLTCVDFKLTKSNFKQWRTEIETQEELEKQLEMLAEENTEISNPLNLLSEIVLKAGYGLLHVDALHHEEPLSDGNILHCIKRRGEEGKLPELFICLTPYAPEILQKLRQIKYALDEEALSPRFVILDQCFEGKKSDEQLANLKLELEDLGVELEIL
ncbi:site-specific DNA-methyltransferase [Acetobacteraceae bacterium]|nr:site-specific DNA-methyltransferase [Acetobacteraceae bacterium]